MAPPPIGRHLPLQPEWGVMQGCGGLVFTRVHACCLMFTELQRGGGRDESGAAWLGLVGCRAPSFGTIGTPSSAVGLHGLCFLVFTPCMTHICPALVRNSSVSMHFWSEPGLAASSSACGNKSTLGVAGHQLSHLMLAPSTSPAFHLGLDPLCSAGNPFSAAV